MDLNKFNKSHPVGSPVIYLNDLGVKEKTFTASEAWELCGVAVIKLVGKTGGFDLGRVSMS